MMMTTSTTSTTAAATIANTCTAISLRRASKRHQCAISAMFPHEEIDRRALDKWVTGCDAGPDADADDDDDDDDDDRKPSKSAARMKLLVEESAECCICCCCCAATASCIHSFFSFSTASTISGA